MAMMCYDFGCYILWFCPKFVVIICDFWQFLQNTNRNDTVGMLFFVKLWLIFSLKNRQFCKTNWKFVIFFKECEGNWPAWLIWNLYFSFYIEKYSTFIFFFQHFFIFTHNWSKKVCLSKCLSRSLLKFPWHFDR